MELSECEEMSQDIFAMWTVAALQEFVVRRGYSKQGSKADLVARAFVSWERKDPILQREVDLAEACNRQYQDRLRVGDTVLPDPDKIPEIEWKGEKGGLKLWPPIMLWDISQFLLADQARKDIGSRILNEYKEGKGYRYYTSEWLKEVFFHDLGHVGPDLCFLKAQCTPSQRLSDVPHRAWILVYKTTGEVYQSVTASRYLQMDYT